MREEIELNEYLGAEFDRSRLERYEQQLDDEYAGFTDERAFYRSSRGYLYNLTAFAMTGTKLPYLATVTRLVTRGGRILDYGCGIGSDGLLLLDAGYRVEFADFDNPSVEYLRWRLRRRGLAAPVHDIDAHVPGGFDAALALDVIEHVPDPFEFLATLEARARLVVVNLLEPEPGETELHHELPVKSLLDHAGTRRLLSYRIFHGRSHLVAYESVAANPPQRAVSRAKLRLGRLSARLRRAVRT